MARVSIDAFVRRAWREESANCSTYGAASGWVNRRHPPATGRSTIPDRRSSYSRASSPRMSSTSRRPVSRACARTDELMGSSETNRIASRAILTSAMRSSISCSLARSSPGPPAHLHAAVMWTFHGTFGGRLGRPMPADLDVAEQRRLGEVDLPFTVQLQDGQEPHHHLDLLGTPVDQIPEPRPGRGPQALLHRPEGVRHRSSDG